MAQRYADSSQTNPIDLLLTEQALSRRSMVRNLAGWLFVGAGLTPLVSACSSQSTGAPPPALSRTPTLPSFGNLLLTYRGHTDKVDHLAWSPDGQRIASGSDDETVQVWDTANGSHSLTYHGHTLVVNAVSWSPDGTHIASGSRDQTVQVWEATTGKTVLTYRGH